MVNTVALLRSLQLNIPHMCVLAVLKRYVLMWYSRHDAAQARCY